MSLDVSVTAPRTTQVMRPWPPHPQSYARLAGAIYLVVIVFGGFSEGFVMNKLIVSGDAAATAHNITASSSLWRLSVAGNLIVPLIAVVQLWIEYILLRPVSRSLALLFVFFNIVSLSVESISKLFLLMVLPIIKGDGSDGVFGAQQLYTLADLALGAHNIAFNIALIFFGCACLVSGHLIFRASYFPKVIGILMQLAGGSYLIASFSELFVPALAHSITPAILLPVLVGETSFCLWLLFKGVNVAKWNAQLAVAHRA